MADRAALTPSEESLKRRGVDLHEYRLRLQLEIAERWAQAWIKRADQIRAQLGEKT